MNPLFEYVEQRVATDGGTHQNVADQVGISLSAFLRALKGGTLSIKNCLRIAEIYGEDPGRVLRMGGKQEVADMLERLFEKSAQPRYTAQQRLILDGLSRLPPMLTANLLTWLSNFAQGKVEEGSKDEQTNVSLGSSMATPIAAKLLASAPAQLVSADPANHGRSRTVHDRVDLETIMREMRETTAALRLALIYTDTLSGNALAEPSRQAAKARATVARKRARTRKNRRKGSGAA